MKARSSQMRSRITTVSVILVQHMSRISVSYRITRFCVVGLAIICNLTAAGLGGVLVPLVIDKLKFDPAVASGAFVTTITDVVGFFSFLGIATLWFKL